MIRVSPVLVVIWIAAALGGCQAANDFVLGAVSDAGEGQVVTGVYHRTLLSGDLFDFSCRYGHVCQAVLVRDEYLREHYVSLGGRKLVLRVERTNACHDPRSSQFACQTSRDGTALVILQWIRPEV
ncbi:MAG TPA: hypothetical protein VHY79_07545 [Rhizomicrobium sp.]|jgi:hypothetical protein|nr:hypothetical protein [Rhizomicrobium sp.]